MNYLQCLVEKIHTVIAATVDENGKPVTCAIDMMDYDESGLYFLTAKGKGFYQRLKNKEYIALTGIKGENTMHCVALSVSGKVKEIGTDYLPELLIKNPYMAQIYPTEESRQALTVFKLYEGCGEWFDLSRKPIERDSFTFGGAEKKEEGYFINNDCIGCETCSAVCPQQCIDFSNIPTVINQKNCLHCGNCIEACPVDAVIKQ